MTGRTIVISPVPTANGDLHLGHRAGPFLAADIYTRYARAAGREVAFGSGVQDTPTYVVTTADRLGTTPEALVRRSAKQVEETLAAVGIEVDGFTGIEERFTSFARRLVDHLRVAGKLRLQPMTFPYSPHTGRYLVDGHVRGGCPVCLADGRAGLCECCGHPIAAGELIDPRSTVYPDAPVELRAASVLVLPMEQYRDRLRTHFAAIGATLRPHLPQPIDEMLSRQLPDFPVTYPISWGIPTPGPEVAGQVINPNAEPVAWSMYCSMLAAERRGAEPVTEDALWRPVLTRAGLVQPAFELTASREQARAAAERIGYPVVKPQALGASMGVVLATDRHELDAAFEVAAGASRIGDAPFRGTAIVEEYAIGPEISVDAAVHMAEYLPMFVARKRTGMEPYFEEVGHVVDAADPLPQDEVLLQTPSRAHREVGIENGITDTEVRLTRRGPLIIEVNGRLGGDLIPALGSLATGIDPGHVLVDHAIGQRPDLEPSRNTVAGIRFGYPVRDCAVRSITVPAEAPGLVAAKAMAEPGAELQTPPGGDIARHSYVVCTADDAVTCETMLDATSARVNVDGDPWPPPAVGAGFGLPAGLLDVEL